MSTIRKCDYCGVGMTDRDTRLLVRTPQGGMTGSVHLCVWPENPGGNFWDACLDCHIKLLIEARDAQKKMAEGTVAKEERELDEALKAKADNATSGYVALSEHQP